MPYSVSMPMTFGMATLTNPLTREPGRFSSLQVLPGADPFHLLTGPALVGDQRAHVDDPLALLPRDARPVVGVRGVRQILVLLELVPDRAQQVLRGEALLAGLQEPFDGDL